MRLNKGFEGEVGEKVKKIENLNRHVKREKARTKDQERVINAFTQEIHRLVQTKNERIYKEGLLKIFEKFVKPYQEEILARKKKDPETIEEMDRQLRFLEKCKGQMKLNAQRSDFAFKHVKKEEMLDNVELMKELKKMREKKRKYEIELRKLE